MVNIRSLADFKRFLAEPGVYFTTGWLQFPKASLVRFDGDTATFDMNQDGKFEHVLVYRLTKG